MRRAGRVGIGVLLVIGAVVGATVLVGSLRTTHAITVTRETTATPEAIWALWADVPGRPRWDAGLERITIDGPFRAGARGEVLLQGQPARAYEVVAVEPPVAFTDRFELPLGTYSDWQHRITETGDGRRAVTFRVTVRGPSSAMLAPIMRSILTEELPPAVDRLVAIAEADGQGGSGS